MGLPGTGARGGTMTTTTPTGMWIPGPLGRPLGIGVTTVMTQAGGGGGATTTRLRAGRLGGGRTVTIHMTLGITTCRHGTATTTGTTTTLRAGRPGGGRTVTTHMSLGARVGG